MMIGDAACCYEHEAARHSFVHLQELKHGTDGVSATLNGRCVFGQRIDPWRAAASSCIAGRGRGNISRLITLVRYGFGIQAGGFPLLFHGNHHCFRRLRLSHNAKSLHSSGLHHRCVQGPASTQALSLSLQIESPVLVSQPGRKLSIISPVEQHRLNSSAKRRALGKEIEQITSAPKHEIRLAQFCGEIACIGSEPEKGNSAPWLRELRCLVKE